MTSNLASVFRFNNGETLTCDSRDLASAIDVAHDQFLSKVILRYQAEIEKETDTPIILLSQKQQGKAGRPTRYAQLNVYQVVFALSLCKTTPKVLSAIAYILNDIMKKKIEVVELAPQWDKLAKRMRPTHRIIEQAKVRISEYANGKLINIYHDYRPQQLDMYHETHFSPDEEIAKFLHNIEEVLGYSLPISLDTRQLQLDVVYENDELNGTNFYDELREKLLPEVEDEEDEEDEEYEEDCVDDDEDYDKEYEKLEEVYGESAGCLIADKYYEIDELDQGYNYSNLHTTVNEQESTQESANRLYYLSMLTNKLAHEEKDYTVYDFQMQALSNQIETERNKVGWGFQAHADFNNWWQDLEDLKETKFFDYSDTFDEIKRIKMPDSAYYETGELLNGKEICEAIEDSPIFNLLVVYPNKVKPLFDYYMENIWYPKHALSWVGSIDPTAINKLQEAILKTTKSKLRRLPVTFLTALQATLPEASKRQALR